MEKHGRRLVKSTGDRVLLEFPSVVDAVECAVAVQEVMAQRNEGLPGDRQTSGPKSLSSFRIRLQDDVPLKRLGI